MLMLKECQDEFFILFPACFQSAIPSAFAVPAF